MCTTKSRVGAGDSPIKNASLSHFWPNCTQFATAIHIRALKDADDEHECLNAAIVFCLLQNQ
jgi:hypothetical protein